MNGAHFHLVINHFPIILPVVGVVILLTGLIAKSAAINRTGFLIFILGALTSIFAMTSGEQAEEVVENLAGISENFIETHEEDAETFSILNYILGGISLLGLWVSFTKRSFINIFSYLTIAFAFVTLFFAQKAGTSGGEIRHTEIRDVTNQNSSINYTTEGSEDDD